MTASRTQYAVIIAGVSGVLWSLLAAAEAYNGARRHITDVRALFAAAAGIAVAASCLSPASRIGWRARLQTALALQSLSIVLWSLHEWGHLHGGEGELLLWLFGVLSLEVWFLAVGARERRTRSPRN